MDPNVLMNPAIMQAQLQAREAELAATAAKTRFETLANAQQLAALGNYTQQPQLPLLMPQSPAQPPAEDKGTPWLTIIALVIVGALIGAGMFGKHDGRDHQGYSTSSH